MEDIEQLSLFDDILTEYKITKPVRLISFFSGIEAQYKALSVVGHYLNVPVESYKTCEWAFNSIVGCNTIHNRDFTDYSVGLTKEEMLDKISGISVDYNQPLTEEQLWKKPLSWVRKAYNNCIANHNLLNIMNVKGKDLEIVDTDKYEYIVTYSFPCQDLSLAGQRAGMSVSQAEEGGTRSGLLWEVERILGECKELGNMPNVLIMENVPQIHSEKDMPNFRKWIHRLEELGYTSFYEDLNAKNYGIPQNRERTFMVSILGKDWLYKFPRKIERKYNLKDFLENKVDESYYLSQKMIDYLTGINQKESKYDRGSVFERNLNPNKDVAAAVLTTAGQRATDNFIVEDDIQVVGNYMPSGHNAGRVVDPKGIAPTVMENHGTVTAVAIRENTLDGYRVAHEGDGVNISSRMHHQRGNVQEGMAQTLKTTMEVGVVVSDVKTEYCDKLIDNNLVQEGDVINHAFASDRLKEIDSGIVHIENTKDTTNSPAITTRADCLGVVVKPSVSLRIRKLTPTECGRLMGFQDIDTDRMRECGLGNAALYHVFGDSIVVCILIGIFAKLFGVGQNVVKEIINEYIETIRQ